MTKEDYDYLLATIFQPELRLNKAWLFCAMENEDRKMKGLQPLSLQQYWIREVLLTAMQHP